MPLTTGAVVTLKNMTQTPDTNVFTGTSTKGITGINYTIMGDSTDPNKEKDNEISIKLKNPSPIRYIFIYNRKDGQQQNFIDTRIQIKKNGIIMKEFIVDPTKPVLSYFDPVFFLVENTFSADTKTWIQLPILFLDINNI